MSKELGLESAVMGWRVAVIGLGWGELRQTSRVFLMVMSHGVHDI